MRPSLRMLSSGAAMCLAPLTITAQTVVYQQPPTFIERVFAPVVETVETITAAPTNQVYVSSPSQTIVTSPSRVTTARIVQTQARVSDPVFDSLARQLRDILPDRRREAAFALGQLRNPRAVPLLLDRLRVDLNKNVRKACVVALSQIPDPAIPGYLERVAIYDPNAEVRQLATNLMKKLSETVIVETPVEVPTSVTTVIPSSPTTVIQTPGAETVTTSPTIIGGIQPGSAIPPSTAQLPGQLRGRTVPGTTQSEIISQPIESPAVNPLAPGSKPPAEPELKQPGKPSSGPSTPGITKPGTTPPLAPPASEPPPLEALPDEIPQNSRNDGQPQLTKPRSA